MSDENPIPPGHDCDPVCDHPIDVWESCPKCVCWMVTMGMEHQFEGGET